MGILRFGLQILLICLGFLCTEKTTQSLELNYRLADAKQAIQKQIKASGAESVGVAVFDLESRESLLINEDVEMHAASTMKIAVMMEVFRLASNGKLSLDDRLEIRNRFASVVDGSEYQLNSRDDSEGDLYQQLGSKVAVRELVALMITRSSNLATNILIDRVGAAEVTSLIRRLGAKRMMVQRGVEDGKAFRAGMNNTATAFDLMLLLRVLAEHRAFGAKASEEMIHILKHQEFNEALPAGLPKGVEIAHKTGSITRIKHDVGVVFPAGRKPYSIAILTRGLETEAKANELISEISRQVYQALTGPVAGRKKAEN